ncbi:MAG: FecR domain-containing protein [Spirochaetes bacterium]|nr:FecR domain-containing protein [Spirochaetota bacterium]
MKIVKHVLLIVSGIMVLFAYCQKISKPSSAKIIFLAGDVTIVRNQNAVVATIGKALERSDAFVTGEKSSAVIQIGEQVIARIGSESNVTIQSLFERIMEFSLEKGEIISKVQKLSKGHVYSIKTPTLVASVRETEFLVRADEKERRIAVNNGEVHVTSVSEKVTEKKLISGKCAIANANISAETITDNDVVFSNIPIKDKLKISSFAKLHPVSESELSNTDELQKRSKEFEKK